MCMKSIHSVYIVNKIAVEPAAIVYKWLFKPDRSGISCEKKKKSSLRKLKCKWSNQCSDTNFLLAPDYWETSQRHLYSAGATLFFPSRLFVLSRSRPEILNGVTLLEIHHSLNIFIFFFLSGAIIQLAYSEYLAGVASPCVPFAKWDFRAEGDENCISRRLK